MFTFITKMNGEKIKKLALLSSLVLSLVANAQLKEQNDDSKLLDSFIQSKGYGSTITFSPSNIKQFWIEKTVISQDNLIKVFLDINKKSIIESSPFKIQLANVNETQDCRVDVISNTELKFSVLDNALKVISTSSAENNFIDYNIASASFHLENTKGLSFYLQFSSTFSKELDIQRIILSFSPNKDTSFLASPGSMTITDSDIGTTGGIIDIKKTDSEKSFVLSCKRTGIQGKKKILVPAKPLSNSVVIRNVGDKATQIYFGFIPYTKDGKEINNSSNVYKTNKIMKIVSAEKNSNTIVVDSEPEWEKGCYLALNAKEDLSDFPNVTLVDGRIQSVIKKDENHFEIVFDKTNKKEISVGIPVRVQAPHGATYIYTNIKRLLPGEEVKLSSEIKKDDTCTEFRADRFCRGTYYVVPVLLSHSVDKTEENSIQITDFTVDF